MENETAADGTVTHGARQGDSGKMDLGCSANTIYLWPFQNSEERKGVVMKKVRIACISGWQTRANDFAVKANSYPESDTVAVWDEDVERGRRTAEAVGCRFEGDLDRLLSSPDIDAVIITSAPTAHARHIISAAKAGKHIFVEKPLCITNEDAYAIRDAVQASGVHFTLSDPIIKPALVQVKKMMDSGVIGRVTSARSRVSFGVLVDEALQDPERVKRAVQFGGALGDSHTVHILSWLLGKPVSSTAIFQKDPGGQTDVNTVAVYQFESGAIGVAEACIVAEGCPYALEVYGTGGAIFSNKDAVYYKLGAGEWRKVPDKELPEPMTYILHYWVKSICNDEPNDFYTIEDGVHAVQMQNAARKAAGQAVPVEWI